MDMRQKEVNVQDLQRAICFGVGFLSGGILFVFLYIVLFGYDPDDRTSSLYHYFCYGFVAAPMVSGYLGMLLGPICFGRKCDLLTRRFWEFLQKLPRNGG